MPFNRMWLLAAAALTIAVATGLSACNDGALKEKHGQTARPVLVQRVTHASRQPSRSFSGTIRPRVESDLGFRVAGKVERRLVTVGDRVRKGDRLAQLNEVDLRLQTEQADAELRAATANLRQASADLRRIATLSEKGYTATANLDRQQAVEAEVRSRVLRAERALTIARNALSYAALAADADGIIVATSVEPGQVMSAGQPAIRLAHSSEKEAVVAIPESFEIRPGARAAVTLWSRPGHTYDARLREIAPAADPTSRTYLAKFSVPEADDVVQLGMTATVMVGSGEGDKVVRLPLSALFSQGDGPSVWLIDGDGRPRLRPVTVASYEAREVLVSAGLQDGDLVATLGVTKLDEGQTVRTVDKIEF